MDAGISPDGKIQYISCAIILPGALAPRKSELMVARRCERAGEIAPDSDRIMKSITTGTLAYASAISANGLELYFTRASQFEVVVATRSSLNDALGEPRVLSALTGFVEAPSVSLDASEIFFHKKVGVKYLIYRAVRSVIDLAFTFRAEPMFPTTQLHESRTRRRQIHQTFAICLPC